MNTTISVVSYKHGFTHLLHFVKMGGLHCEKMLINLRLFPCLNIEDFLITVNVCSVCVLEFHQWLFFKRSEAWLTDSDPTDNLLALRSSCAKVYGSLMSFSNCFFQVVAEYQQN